MVNVISFRRPPAPPKRQGADAVQDASRHARAAGNRASVLDCGGPPPLFPGAHGVTCPTISFHAGPVARWRGDENFFRIFISTQLKFRRAVQKLLAKKCYLLRISCAGGR